MVITVNRFVKNNIYSGRIPEEMSLLWIGA